MHGDELGHVRSGGDPMSPTKSGTRVVWPSTDVERSNISRSAFYRDMLRIAKKLPVVEKIHNGGFDEITLQDCEKLFEVLDVDKSGRLDELEVSMLMKEVLNQGCTDEEVSTIFEQTDRVVDGKVSFAELHKALTDAAGAIRLSIEKKPSKGNCQAEPHGGAETHWCHDEGPAQGKARVASQQRRCFQGSPIHFGLSGGVRRTRHRAFADQPAK